MPPKEKKMLTAKKTKNNESSDSGKNGKETSKKKPESSPPKQRESPPKPSKTIKYGKRECFIYEGKDSLTDEDSKTFLGWQEETDNIKFGNDYLIKDEYGKKIRMLNNLGNRPISNAVFQTLKMEILRNNWKFNFENIIIGKYGTILNGQHTLIALVLACQAWDKNLEWREFWSKRPTIEKSVGVGVEETDSVINTMDTCKPRDFSDVIFRSVHLIDLDRKNRLKAAKIVQFAVRLLEDRTGAKISSSAPKRTHTESMAFLQSHQRLLEAVAFINEENCDGVIGKFISPGQASALMYLMSSSKTEADSDGGYHQVNDPSEALIDFSLWDKAEEFWVFVAQGTEALLPIRSAIVESVERCGGTRQERIGIFVKAWNLWSVGKKVTKELLALEYEKDPDGFYICTDWPTVGGIDLGNPEIGEE